MSGGSTRALSQEERVTKKVKSKELGEVGKEGVSVLASEGASVMVVEEGLKESSVANILNFKEALLNVADTSSEEEFGDGVDTILPEDRWYIEQEDPKEYVDEEGLIPVIQVSDEELQDWCDVWQLTLVVNVLGKKLNYRVLENKILRDWARSGGVKIVDLPKGYYAV